MSERAHGHMGKWQLGRRVDGKASNYLPTNPSIHQPTHRLTN